MRVLSIFNGIKLDLTIMTLTQAALLSPGLAAQTEEIGRKFGRLRRARQVKQADAALRAGLSRNTAYRIEKGDPGLAVGLILRYLDAISPGASLESLLLETDPALKALASREATQRVRGLTAAERDELDF